MIHSLRVGVGLVAIGWLLTVGCGGDDDDDGDDNGGSGGSTSGSSGDAGDGGATPKGGTAGTAGSTPMGGGGAGGEGGQASGATECKVLGTLCHEGDTGSGPIHECHDLGHVGDGAVCREEFASCIGVCLGGGEGGAGGGGAGGEGGAPPAGDPYCRALGELCHEVDDMNGPLHECHEVGHVGDPVACAAEFETCAAACLAAREAGEGGAGGGGAAP